MGKLDGKVALVTGASMGLGKEIARLFLCEGACVIGVARNPDGLWQTALDWSMSPDRFAFQEADISKSSDVADLPLDQVDILVNNAAVHGPKGRLADVNRDEWWQAVKVNLRGPVLTMRAAIPHMLAKRRGKIINISGGGATKPMYGLSAYAASKAALVRLTETVALELAGTGIDVNAVAPGALNTRLLDDLLEVGPEKVGAAAYREKVRQRETGGDSLQQAADLCLFLASAESDGITGRLISAKWDDWRDAGFAGRLAEDANLYTLRRQE